MTARSTFLFGLCLWTLAHYGWAGEGELQPNIVIEDNVIVDNGLGVYVGWSSDWITLIVGNRIARNGEGIRVVNRAAYIERNEIVENVIGLQVTPVHQEELVTQVEKVILRGNVFSDNELYAVLNLADVPLQASGNWWGRPEGPRWEIGVTLVEWLSRFFYALFEKSGIVLTSSLTAEPAAQAFPALSLVGTLTLPPISLRWGLGSAESFLVQATAPKTYGNLVKGPLMSQGWLSSPPREGTTE